MGANFTPTFGAYSPLTPFRYWCQKVLPLVYDDSLSYYECLNKTVDYLNKTMEDVETLHGDTEAMLAAFNALQTYVNTYFDELDLTEEVQTVLDRMAENGSLDELLRPLVGEQIGGVVAEQIDDVVAGQIYNTVAEQINAVVASLLPEAIGNTVPEAVSDWLSKNVEPVGSAVVVDNSLTIAGAAADAKVTGDRTALNKKIADAACIEKPSYYTWLKQSYNATTGAPVSSIYAYSTSVRDVVSKGIKYTGASQDSNGKVFTVQMHEYDQNNALIGDGHNLNTGDYLFFSDNAKYYRILFRRQAADAIKISASDLNYFSAELVYETEKFYDNKNKIKMYTNKKELGQNITIEENYNEHAIYKTSGNNKLYEYALGNETYLDLFEYKNLFNYGTFEGSQNLDSMITGKAGNPIITEEDHYLGNKSLKCFGTVSTQISLTYPGATKIRLYLACMVKVTRYVSGGGCGVQYSATSALINRVTDGWELASILVDYDPTNTTRLYFGSISSANLDAYIDNACVIDCSNVNANCTKENLDSLYLEYLNIKRTEVKTLIGNLSVKSRYDGLFAVSVLSATGITQRFLAAKQLLDIANKKLENSEYSVGDSDFTYATKGSVSLIPNINSSMLENYPFTYLFNRNADIATQPGSVSKVLTAITAMDYLADLKNKTVIKSSDVQAGSGNYLRTGDSVSFEDLIFGMMLPSSNTSAQALARSCGAIILSLAGVTTITDADCITAFVNAMNAKASTIGMANSTFEIPSGLSANNLTTTEDLIKLAVDACSYDRLNRIWNKKEHTVVITGGRNASIDIETSVTNATLEEDYYIIGGKTGSLDPSGTTGVDAKSLLLVVKNK